MEKNSSWNDSYRSGRYKHYWGIPYPSQELVSFIATMNYAKPVTALDVGCGAGQEAIFMAQQGFTVVGVDFSQEAIKIAKQQAAAEKVEVTWHCADVLDIPLPDGSFDVVNDRGCLHNLPNEVRSQYAKEMARLIKPGGRLLLRGCRNPQAEPFHVISSQTITPYFAADFHIGSFLPIRLATGDIEGGLDAHLVILTRK